MAKILNKRCTALCSYISSDNIGLVEEVVVICLAVLYIDNLGV